MERGQHMLAMITAAQHHCVTSTVPEKIGVALRSKFPKNRKYKFLGLNKRLMVMDSGLGTK